MSWIELSIDTTHEAVDWVSTLLATTDYTGGLTITPYAKPELDSLTDQAVVSPHWAFTIRLYLPYDIGVNARVEKLDHLLQPLHRTGLTTSLETAVVEEKLASRDGTSPLVHRIGQRFVVLRTDVPYPLEAADDIILRLETSLTFGSGLHPATMGCLQLLERYIVPSMNVLDLGCGSGILSVAMAKLGAQVLALDNDQMAVQATQEAVRLNQVEQQVTVWEGSLGGGSELGHWMGGITSENVPTFKSTSAFDLIVTNILARVHIALVQDYKRALRRTDAYGGLLITAGFTSDYEDEVTNTLIDAGFEAVDCARSDEWVVLAHRLKV